MLRAQAKKCLEDNMLTGTVDDSTFLFQLTTAKMHFRYLPSISLLGSIS